MSTILAMTLDVCQFLKDTAHLSNTELGLHIRLMLNQVKAQTLHTHLMLSQVNIQAVDNDQQTINDKERKESVQRKERNPCTCSSPSAVISGVPQIIASQLSSVHAKTRKNPIPLIRENPEEKAPTKELLTYFDELHKQTFHLPAAITGGKDAALIAKLCHSYPPDLIRTLMGAFFASTDPWIQQAGYTVGVFHVSVAKLIARQNQHLLPPADHSAGRPKNAAQRTLETWRRLEAEDAARQRH